MGKHSSGPRESRHAPEYARPRRPNLETIQYLKSLPLDPHVASEEISTFLSNGGAFPQTLAAAFSAIDEIQKEVGSLAGDEAGAEVIELLAAIVCPHSELASRFLLLSVQGYCVHLATHRYGSHVLQTLIHSSVIAKCEKDMASYEDAPPLLLQGSSELPSLQSLLISIQEELAPHLKDLAVHMCGSHVLRTLICSLGGFRLVREKEMERSGFHRRGKSKSKKAHESDSFLTTQNTEIAFETDSRTSTMDNTIAKSLTRITDDLTGTSVTAPGELQQKACNSSAGPVLIVLLRVLTYSEASQDDLLRLEEWDRDGRIAGQPLGKLRPEPRFVEGSLAFHFAQRLLCLQDGVETQSWAAEVIYSLSGEAHGSHVLEVLLKLCPDSMFSAVLEAGFVDKLEEYVNHDVSNFVVQNVLANTRDRDQALTILERLSPLISNGLLVDRRGNRGGVLWRATEAAAKHKVFEKELVKLIVKGCEAAYLDAGVRSLAGCVPRLLDLEPSNDSTRRHFHVAGARTLYSLLRFEPQLCEDSLKGVLSLPAQDLECLCTDHLGSRCLWDGILEGNVSDPIFASAVRQLLAKLKGRWVALASDRVGHHSVKKIFRVLAEMKDRKVLVDELATGKARLNGSPMGRAVMDACCVNDFITKGEKVWASFVSKKLGKGNWIADLEGRAPKAPERSHPQKRKHQDRSASSRKVTKVQKMTVASIMDTISAPGKK